MSNKKKTREAEAQAEIARQQSVAAAKAVELPSQARQALEFAGQDLAAARGGDVTRVGAVSNFLSQQARQNEARRRVSATGAAGLSFANANPTLLAMNEQALSNQRAQDTALGVTGLALESQDRATSDIAGFSGMDIGARAQQAGFLFQNASRAWDRYQFEKAHRGFWQNFALAGVQAAGQAAAGGFFGGR